MFFQTDIRKYFEVKVKGAKDGSKPSPAVSSAFQRHYTSLFQTAAKGKGSPVAIFILSVVWAVFFSRIAVC
jgi:hypothetical protein